MSLSQKLPVVALGLVLCIIIWPFLAPLSSSPTTDSKGALEGESSLPNEGKKAKNEKDLLFSSDTPSPTSERSSTSGSKKETWEQKIGSSSGAEVCVSEFSTSASPTPDRLAKIPPPLLGGTFPTGNVLRSYPHASFLAQLFTPSCDLNSPQPSPDVVPGVEACLESKSRSGQAAANFVARTSWLFDPSLPAYDRHDRWTTANPGDKRSSSSSPERDEVLSYAKEGRQRLCENLISDSVEDGSTEKEEDIDDDTMMVLPPMEVNYDPTDEQGSLARVKNVCLHPRGGLAGHFPLGKEQNVSSQKEQILLSRLLGPFGEFDPEGMGGPGWFDRPDEALMIGCGFTFFTLRDAPRINKKTQWKGDTSLVASVWSGSGAVHSSNIYHIVTKGLNRLSLERRLEVTSVGLDAKDDERRGRTVVVGRAQEGNGGEKHAGGVETQDADGAVGQPSVFKMWQREDGERMAPEARTTSKGNTHHQTERRSQFLYPLIASSETKYRIPKFKTWASPMLREVLRHLLGKSFSIRADMAASIWSLFRPLNAGEQGKSVAYPLLKGLSTITSDLDGAATVEADKKKSDATTSSLFSAGALKQKVESELMCFKEVILGYDSSFKHHEWRLQHHRRIATAFRQRFRKACPSSSLSSSMSSYTPKYCGIRNKLEKRSLPQPFQNWDGMKVPKSMTDEELFEEAWGGEGQGQGEGEGGNHHNTNLRRYKLVLVTRADTGRRMLLRTGELIHAVYQQFKKQLVVQMVHPSSLTIQQQIKMFATADIFIGVHGAALTWSFLMPPNAVVIELSNYHRFGFVDGINQNCYGGFYGPLAASFSLNHILHFAPQGAISAKWDRNRHLDISNHSFVSLVGTALCLLEAGGDRYKRASCELDSSQFDFKSNTLVMKPMWSKLHCMPGCGEEKARAHRLAKSGGGRGGSWDWVDNRTFVRYDARFFDKCVPVESTKDILDHPLDAPEKYYSSDLTATTDKKSSGTTTTLTPDRRIPQTIKTVAVKCQEDPACRLLIPSKSGAKPPSVFAYKDAELDRQNEQDVAAP